MKSCCAWYASGEISRCSRELAVVTTLLESPQQRKGNVQCYVPRAPSRAKTSKLIGRRRQRPYSTCSIPSLVFCCNTDYKYFRYLFALFLGNDANFRMVRKKVSSEEADPTLSAGWSYFCEMTKYREHLAKYGDQKEVVSHWFMFCCTYTLI